MLVPVILKESHAIHSRKIYYFLETTLGGLLGPHKLESLTMGYQAAM